MAMPEEAKQPKFEFDVFISYSHKDEKWVTETLLPLSLALYHNGDMPLLKVLGALTQKPGEILRLQAGRLAIGAPADLLLFDLDAPWRIEVDKFRSKSKNSPYDGRPVQGRALRTFVGGRTVFAREA